MAPSWKTIDERAPSYERTRSLGTTPSDRLSWNVGAIMHQHLYQWQAHPGLILDRHRVSLLHLRGFLLLHQQIPSGLTQRQKAGLHVWIIEVLVIPGLYRIRWYDCIASYARKGTLFVILLTFPRSSDYAATSTTSGILRILAATFLQPVLHAGRGYKFTSQMIMYHKNSILHIPRHPLLAFKNCTLLWLCAFLRLLHIFTISIRSYIRSLSRTSQASDQSCNRFISISSCVPAAECYC